MNTRKCKDCEAVPEPRPIRPAPHPGPRCATCWRAEKKRRSEARHAAMIKRTYNLTGEQYTLLLAYQAARLGNPPGTCAVCGVANGRTKRLAVDHDHWTGQVRGILCGPCNKDVLGRLGIEALQRAIAYLMDPPGQILSPL